jgi:hypothetical protein
MVEVGLACTGGGGERKEYRLLVGRKEITMRRETYIGG